MSRVGCAILAAGASQRLGRPKQLVLWRGHELVRHLALQALSSRASEVAVIVGAHAEVVVPAVSDLPLTCVMNLDWKEGVASSIRFATHWAAKREMQALIVMTSDQLHLDRRHLDRLISEHEGGADQVASWYGGVCGVPALFSEKCYRRLLTLSGNAGASALLRDEPNTRSVEWSAGEFDIDTVPDLALLSGDVAEPRRPIDYLCSVEPPSAPSEPWELETQAFRRNREAAHRHRRA